ncbi:hypothetical protein BDN71DRAFT_1433765, partial [Pleurotus eryngii]
LIAASVLRAGWGDGPRKYPIIGSLLKVPSDNLWVVYDRLAKECNSDIIHLSVFGNSEIVLDSFAAATEVLDRQSSISSSRHYDRRDSFNRTANVGATVVGCFGKSSIPNMIERTVVPFNPVAHGTSFGVSTNHPSTSKHTFVIRSAISAGVIMVLYGLDIQEKVPNITMAPAWSIYFLFSSTSLDGYFRAVGENAARDPDLLIDVPYSQTRKLLAEGRGESSFIHRALSRGLTPDGGTEERTVKEAATTTYIGSNETSMLPMTLLFAITAQNPDVQAKAEQELDQYRPPPS